MRDELEQKYNQLECLYKLELQEKEKLTIQIKSLNKTNPSNDEKLSILEDEYSTKFDLLTKQVLKSSIM